MELHSELIDGITVVHIRVESLDAGTVKRFKAATDPVVEENTRIVFDLSSLAFIDSNGIGAILSCLRRLNSRGGDLKLYGLSKSIRSLFELVRMHRIFDIFENGDEAIAAFPHR
jgi:anti-sigma B factor antagonist